LRESGRRIGAVSGPQALPAWIGYCHSEGQFMGSGFLARQGSQVRARKKDRFELIAQDCGTSGRRDEQAGECG